VFLATGARRIWSPVAATTTSCLWRTFQVSCKGRV
jgi:hypothetical protein